MLTGDDSVNLSGNFFLVFEGLELGNKPVHIFVFWGCVNVHFLILRRIFRSFKVTE